MVRNSQDNAYCFRDGLWRGRENKNERHSFLLHSGTFEAHVLEDLSYNITLRKCIAPCFFKLLISSVLFTSLFSPPLQCNLSALVVNWVKNAFPAQIAVSAAFARV